jgi:hypothetical protein
MRQYDWKSTEVWGSKTKPFRFDVDLIGDTVFFVRRENSPTGVIKDVRGYGHTFPENITQHGRPKLAVPSPTSGSFNMNLAVYDFSSGRKPTDISEIPNLRPSKHLQIKLLSKKSLPQ